MKGITQVFFFTKEKPLGKRKSGINHILKRKPFCKKEKRHNGASKMRQPVEKRVGRTYYNSGSSKGITPVIAIVLLLMITIAIVGFSFTFLSSMFAGTAETTSQQIEQQLGAMSSCMQIDSISFDKVYVRNCGSGSLADFSVYVDGESIALTNSPVVAENAAGELALAKGVSGNAIKVTSPSAQVQATLKHCNIDKLLPVNLVGYWMLDNSTQDSSGLGNNAVAFNGTNCSTAVAGKFGSACSFDGIDDYINISTTIWNGLNNTGMTFSAWVKVESITATTHYGIIGGTPSQGYAWYGSGGIMLYNSYPAMITYSTVTGYKNANATTGVAANTWYHIAGVHEPDADKNIIYVNGVKAGEVTGVTNVVAIGTAGRSYIGRNTLNTIPMVINGTIDDVAIWNNALSIDEIRKAYTKNC